MRFRPAYINAVNRRVSFPRPSSALLSEKITQGSPAGTCSPCAAHRDLYGMPERCSRSRVRSAAPKHGAPWTRSAFVPAW